MFDFAAGIIGDPSERGLGYDAMFRARNLIDEGVRPGSGSIGSVMCDLTELA
jgi:hypothetical protein